MSSYEDGKFTKPSVTTIIADCTDKSKPLTFWAADQVVEWIKINCRYKTIAPWENANKVIDDHYLVTESDLESARKNFRTVSEEALNVGSMVHSAIESYLTKKQKPELTNEQAISGFDAFLDWEKDHHLDTHHTELSVYGKYWAGTLDWIGELDGKLTVIDFKASKAIYPEYRYQIAAYRSVAGGVASGILRLDKATGLPEYKDFSKSYEKDLDVFNAMVLLYMKRHPIIAKKAGWEEIGSLLDIFSAMVSSFMKRYPIIAKKVGWKEGGSLKTVLLNLIKGGVI